MTFHTPTASGTWLPPLPTGWCSLRAKRLFRQLRERAEVGSVQLAATQSYGVIPQAEFIERESQKVVLALSGIDNFKQVRVDDFVISLRSFQGGIEHSAYEGAITPAYTVLRPSAEVHVGYFRHVLKSAGFVSALNSTTEGIRDGKAVPYESFGELPLPLPPPDQQRRIAAFLDHETARIDMLVQEQVRLKGLLAERRHATSVAAVSGELLRKMLEQSAVPWLQRHAIEWSPVRIRFVARLGSGHTPSRSHPEYWEDCTVPWITTGEVNQIRHDRIEYLTETREQVSELGVQNSAAAVHPAGTVVLSRTASAGFSAIMGLDMATSQDYVTWTCGPRLRPRFLLLCLRAMRPDLLGRLAMGSTHKTIYFPDVESLTIPLPSVDEQDEAVEQAWSRLHRLDETVDSLDAGVRLLRERRSALITAAVTGQIDVSAWTPPDGRLSPEAA